MIDAYTKVKLRDGRRGVIVDTLGVDYVVDIGASPDDWDTVLVHPDDLEALTE